MEKKRAFKRIAAAFCFIVIVFTASACSFIDWAVEKVKDASEKHTHELEFMERKEPTCETPGRKSYWHCKGCDKTYWDEEAKYDCDYNSIHIPLRSHMLTYNKGVASTCSTNGTRENWYCSQCKNYFKNANGTVSLSSIELPLEKHTIEYVSEQPATGTEAGVKEHYACTVCHKKFKDEAASVPVTDDELTILA